MLQAGVKVALGTDGASSNNRLDMLSDMRLGLLAAKGLYRRPHRFGRGPAFAMATRAGALAMGWPQCGLLREDMQADMALLDGGAENLCPTPDLPAAIVYAAQGLNVRMTMVQGKVLYQDGEFPTLDKEKIIWKAEEAARQLACTDCHPPAGPWPAAKGRDRRIRGRAAGAFGGGWTDPGMGEREAGDVKFSRALDKPCPLGYNFAKCNGEWPARPAVQERGGRMRLFAGRPGVPARPAPAPGRGGGPGAHCCRFRFYCPPSHMGSHPIGGAAVDTGFRGCACASSGAGFFL